MEVVTPGANGHTPAAAAALSPETVGQHLADLLEVTLGASLEELEGPGSLFSPSRKAETLQRSARFASESQMALYVQKNIVNPEENGNHKIEPEGNSLPGTCASSQLE